MSILKSAASRAFDLAVIFALVYGDENMRTFGIYIAGIMTVFVWVGLMVMKSSTAKEIHVSLIRRTIGTITNIGYVYGLIIAGAPVWAAFYILGMVAIRARAAQMCQEEKEAA